MFFYPGSRSSECSTSTPVALLNQPPAFRFTQARIHARTQMSECSSSTGCIFRKSRLCCLQPSLAHTHARTQMRECSSSTPVVLFQYSSVFWGAKGIRLYTTGTSRSETSMWLRISANRAFHSTQSLHEPKDNVSRCGLHHPCTPRACTHARSHRKADL